MIRLIVRTDPRDECFQSKDHLDTSYRVFEVENQAFEELIKGGGSLRLIGIEVTDEHFEMALSALPAAPAPVPAIGNVPVLGESAPVPAVLTPVSKDGVPAPGLSPSTTATRADTKEIGLMQQRWGRWQWRKRLGLKPYPNPMTSTLPAVIKLPG